MSWTQAWEEARTPWDAGKSAPALQQLVAGGTLPDGRVLVPGCGTGYDVLTLASPTRQSVGVDLAPVAAKHFATLKQTHPHGAQASYEVADFFAFSPPDPFDMIWDYTFLCALQPEMRPQWAKAMKTLLAPKGELVALIFPVKPVERDEDGNESGPPFAMSPELVTELLAPELVPVSLERVEDSHPGREGKEWLGRFRWASP